MILKKTNWNQFKPIGFDSVILEQKPKSNRLVSVRFGYFILKIKKYIFLGFFFVISNGFGFDLARFFWFSFSVSGLWNQNWTELIGFLNILISLINFFHDLIFSIILFFNFFSLIDFLLTVKFILFKLKGKKIRTEEGMVHKKETEVFGGPI